MSREVAFVKGHGTHNDFLVIPDDEGRIELSVADVVHMCDRRAGLGADGILRVVNVKHAGIEPSSTGDAEFCMDYRNADGSIAEMCGNGARVFARYLWATGRVESSPFAFATRAGTVVATIHDDGTISITMGKGTLRARTATVSVNGRAYTGHGIDVPNPHAVVWVDDIHRVGSLSDPPTVEPRDLFPEGVNVEFAHICEPGVVEMRVFERGVGETMSCGTGACAVAVMAAQATGFTGTWHVQVPGGSLSVSMDADGEIVLRGPAELVARGTVLLV